MHKPNINILVISISKSFLLGIYDENLSLIKEYKEDGKTTDLLPGIFGEILKEYSLKQIFYVNGPGSYMAIKVSYIFLKTLSIVYDVDLKASDGFYFNNNSPIKALGKKYFFKDSSEKIYVDILGDNKVEEFVLPNILNEDIFDDNNLPSYNLPAVN